MEFRKNSTKAATQVVAKEDATLKDADVRVYTILFLGDITLAAATVIAGSWRGA